MLVVRDRVRIFSTIATTEIDVGDGGLLEIGSGTAINYGTTIGATQSIRIGAKCLIGNHCIIMDNDFHRLEPERRGERPPSAPIVLEDNVWLGARVTVLRGVTIGAGSAVAAGSLVTRDIPPRMLAVGVPARPVQKL
ncbi:MAG TPA: acyltransferase [Polyangiaceae bacterium]|nr:acyltransferase [Polyangiaceae bacterium]